MARMARNGRLEFGGPSHASLNLKVEGLGWKRSSDRKRHRFAVLLNMVGDRKDMSVNDSFATFGSLPQAQHIYPSQKFHVMSNTLLICVDLCYKSLEYVEI